MAKIKHIAIFSDDPERLAKFYVDVFGMKIIHRTERREGSGNSVWVTDGYMEVALIHPASEASPRGINHFGFTFEPDEKAAIFEKLPKCGGELFQPPPGRPYIEDAALDVDGNKFDLSTTGLRRTTQESDEQKVEA